MNEHAVALRASSTPRKKRRRYSPPTLWRPKQDRGGRELLCALTGPGGAGKSVLLESLDHPAELACSLAGRKLLRAPADKQGEARGSIGAPLVLETERGGLFGRGPRLRRLRVIEMALEALQAPGVPAAEAPALLLCLPADGLEDLTDRKPLLDLAARLADRERKAPQRVIVCLTKYERLFLRAGRDAVWRASNPGLTRQTLAWSFGDDGPYGSLRPALEAAATHRKVWVQPVSSFGFVAGSGGANVTPEGDQRRTLWLDQLAEAKSAGERDWRPFLTHDALILAAEGRLGRLGVEFRRLIRKP